MESFQNPGSFVGWDAAARVGHGEDHRLIVKMQGDGDAACRGELVCVGQQVADDLEPGFPIGLEYADLVHIDFKSKPSRFDRAAKHADHVTSHRCHVYWLENRVQAS